MKILIVTNRPIEEYQILCVKTIKRYCVVNDIDFGFVDEYKYNKKYDYVVYMDNSNLIINLLVDIESYIDNKYDLIHLGYSEGIQSKNKFIIIKNNKLYDTVSNVDILKQKITVDKVLVIDHIINLNENNKYSNNDSLENERFLNDIKRDKILFYTTNLNVLIEVKNHIYYQIFNKIYNNKKFLDIDIIYDKYKYDDDSEVFNPNKDIAFVTLYTKQIKDEGIEMEYSLKEYCVKNDYTCYIHRKSELEGKRHPCLEKPYLLKKYLNKHKYLIWIDSDILIFNQKYKIENIINDEYDLIAYKDPGTSIFNSGFLIFRKGQNTSDMINKWIFEIEDKNALVIHGPTHGDQGLINQIVKNDYLNNTLICDNSEINCEVSNYGVKDVKVIHLMGIYGFIRPLFMKYLNYVTFIKNKNIN